MSRLISVPAIARLRRRYPGGSAPPPDPGLGLWQAAVAGVGSVSRAPARLDPLGPYTTADWYVDPTKGTDGVGSAADPFNNLGSAFAVVTDGQRIGVDGGTLALETRIIRSSVWTTGIEVVALNGERPVIDFIAATTGAGSRVITLTGAKELWHGFDVRGWNSEGNGFYIDGDGYDLSAIKATHGDGAGIFYYQGTGGSLRDIAVFRIGDGSSGGSDVPDAVSLTGSTSVQTTGVEIARLFVANGPDDGLDLFRARGIRAWDVVAYEAGRYWNGVATGDGQGCKMGGGDNDAGDNQVVGVLAIFNRANGITHNEAANTSDSDPNIVAAYATAYGNGGLGVDAGGDGATHKNIVRDAIFNGNGTPRYVGANALELRTTSTLSIATPGFTNTTDDFSLAEGSACIGEAITGDSLEADRATQASATGDPDNLGASIVSLRMWKYWSAQDLT